MRIFLRPADIFHIYMASFLAGAFAVAQDWDIADIFLLSVASAMAIVMILKISGRMAMAICGISAVFIFSVMYCHVRAASSAEGMLFSGISEPSITDRIALSPGFSFLPYRNGALLGALIGGSTRRLPGDMKEAMANSGTSYLVGMYGYKLHLIAGTVTTVMASIVPKSIATLAGLAADTCFIAAVGAPVSAIRAGIMIAFVSFAELAGRRTNRNVAILLAAFLMVLWDPSVCGSAGFRLSFASLMGIYTIAPALKGFAAQYLARIRFFSLSAIADFRIGRMLGEMFAFHATVSAAVNLAILPMVARLDGFFPMISFVSNVFAVLPFGAILGLGSGLAIAGFIASPSAVIFAYPLNAILGYERIVIYATGALPFGIPSAIFPPLAVAAYYTMLAIFIWLFDAKGRRSQG